MLTSMDDHMNEEGGNGQEPSSTGPSQPSGPDSTLSLDETLELLADRERRAILRHLTACSDDVTTCDDLADQLHAERARREESNPDEAAVESRLHHVHLPKLREAGLLEYDRRNKHVRYWGDSRVEDWLGEIMRREGSA